MAFNNKENADLDKSVKDDGYRTATGFNGYINNDGGKIKQDGGSWIVKDIRYTDSKDLKKSGRI
jgi:hypothetical protein